MIMLYHTLISPYLVYCNIMWGVAKNSVLSPLFVLQKRAVRLCSGSKFRASSSPLFLNLRVLKLNDINKLYTAIFMYKEKCNILPISCQHLVPKLSSVRSHETRHKSYFKIDKFRTNIRELAINIRGAKLWSALPTVIQNASSVDSFKKMFFSHLKNSYGSFL